MNETEELIEAYAKLAEARATALGEPLIGSDIANTIREAECCTVCDLPLLPGDFVFNDADGGHMHEVCGGSEIESFIGENGEPLKQGDPKPQAHEWNWRPSDLPNPDPSP